MLAGWGAWMAWVIQVAVSESLKMKWSQASALDWLEMDSGNSSIRGS
jgi:hypothetical protein